jgi:hypothetical protein
VVALYQQAAQVVLRLLNYRDRRPTAVRPLDDLWIPHSTSTAVRTSCGRPARWRSLFEDTVRLAPDSPVAGAIRVTGAARKYHGAFALRALLVDPDMPTVLSNLAALYSSLGRNGRPARRAVAAYRRLAAQLLVRDLELARRARRAPFYPGPSPRPRLGEAAAAPRPSGARA